MTGLSLIHSFSQDIAATYVLYVRAMATSQALAQRALDSCHAIGQDAELYEGFDGSARDIVVPHHLRNAAWIGWIKLYDERLRPSQIACAFGHISLWARCMDLDRPIVVLEHDTVMTQRYRQHRYPNAVACIASGGPLGLAGTHARPFANWYYLGGTHAYSIDPLVARRMFGLVLDRGLYAPIDFMLRLADVAIIKTDDDYARLEPGLSTIESGAWTIATGES